MNEPENLLEKLQSRLAISEARQTITTEKQKQAMSKPTYKFDPAKLWSRFKTGDTEHIFLTARAAKDTITLAANEVNELGGPPSAVENESRAETDWRLAREGKGRDFYSNGQAKDVLFIAAAEYKALAKTKSAAAKSATIPKGPTAPAKSSAQIDNGLTITRAEFEKLPASDRAEFVKLGGKTTASAATLPAELTGLAKATAIHKAQAASAVSAKPATTPTAPKSTAPAPSSSARPLFGIDKATAAHRGEAVTHAPSAPPSGLAKATAIHKAQAAAKARK